MEAIRKYSSEPGFPQPVDRWSFAMKQAEWDNVSGGIAGDFGFSVSLWPRETSGLNMWRELPLRVWLEFTGLENH